jgi:hypothetical protein
MSKGRIRRVSIFALLLVALSAAPALAGPAAPWEGAWKAACGLFAPWLRPEALKRPASAKRAVTIGPDGVSNEAAADGKPAGEGSTPVPVSSS